MESVGLFPVLATSAALFATGVAGVLTRKNGITIFMSIELMVNAVNLTFLAYARQFHQVHGLIFVFFIMAIAAAEAAVGLELLDALHQADVALGDQLADREAVAAVAHCDLGDEPQVRVDQPGRRIGVLMLGPALGQHIFLFRRQDRELLDLGQIAVEPGLAAARRDRRRDVSHCHVSLTFSLGAVPL